MKAKGILNHHFFGDYSCGIGLEFSCPESAAAALVLLTGWKQSVKSPHVLIATLDSAQLASFKSSAVKWHLEIEPCGRPDCRGQCRDEEIDGVPHSIDYGPNFTLDVPADPLNQLKFELAA